MKSKSVLGFFGALLLTATCLAQVHLAAKIYQELQGQEQVAIDENSFNALQAEVKYDELFLAKEISINGQKISCVIATALGGSYGVQSACRLIK